MLITPESDPVADGLRTVAGVVADVVYQGVSTQLVVKTDAGATLVVFRQNTERVSDAGTPGTRVRIVWPAALNVVLDEETSLDAARAETSTEEELTG